MLQKTVINPSKCFLFSTVSQTKNTTKHEKSIERIKKQQRQNLHGYWKKDGWCGPRVGLIILLKQTSKNKVKTLRYLFSASSLSLKGKKPLSPLTLVKAGRENTVHHRRLPPKTNNENEEERKSLPLSSSSYSYSTTTTIIVFFISLPRRRPLSLRPEASPSDDFGPGHGSLSWRQRSPRLLDHKRNRHHLRRLRQEEGDEEEEQI